MSSAATLDPQAVNGLAEKIDKLVNHLANPAPNRAEQMLNQQQPPGVSTNYGKDSQPFSLHRFISGYKLKNDHSLCSHEYDVLKRYNKALEATNCGLTGVSGGLWLPTDINETYGGKLTSTTEAEKDYTYVKAVMDSTRPAVDPDELEWLKRRAYIKSQSAFTDSLGGSLVAPPVQGAVIPLIRPNAAVLAAGARSMTLPPNGRFVAPRITGAPDVQAIGEGQETGETDLTTGQMELTSKKIAGAVRMTEEGSAYTSGTMDAIAQAELGRSLGLRMDAYAFYGIGSTQIPAGLTANVYASRIYKVSTENTTAAGISNDGNRLLPQYGDIFPAQIEERSFGVEEGVTGTWIMRPAVYADVVSKRAGSGFAADDGEGPKVDILRRFAEGAPTVFAGRRVVRTTNIRKTVTKGSGTKLSDVFFGIWRYLIMATYGAINFQQGHNGVTFLQGQYLIRGTMFGDIGFEYPEAFLWYDSVLGINATW